ncbi:unnamed protein product [Pieris macdunnoughi]|uniref:Uncharacterized protein n=1 Tax=Pieris macdunnoughi TaxID=345717 RepID=A0A821QX85_9NEOP|nr:unnamed protein product [Pieris macdunnoughi]
MSISTSERIPFAPMPLTGNRVELLERIPSMARVANDWRLEALEAGAGGGEVSGADSCGAGEDVTWRTLDRALFRKS